jgi:hypothetical protein
MALLLVPFFMPLFLIGWVLTPREEREHRLLESRREHEIAATWGVLYRQVGAPDDPSPG